MHNVIKFKFSGKKCCPPKRLTFPSALQKHNCWPKVEC